MTQSALEILVGLDSCLLDKVLRGRKKLHELTLKKFKTTMKSIHALSNKLSSAVLHNPMKITRTSYLMQIEFHIPHVNDYVSCQLSCDISERKHFSRVNTKHGMLIRKIKMILMQIFN